MLDTDKKHQIKELYRKGIKPKDIVKELNKDKDTEKELVSLNMINKYISKELKDLKDEHKKNAKEILFNTIGELYRKGSTSVEIGNEVNLASTTVSKYTKIYFKHLRNEHIKNSKSELVNKISNLYEKGFTTTEIGCELGINSSTIMNYTSKLEKYIKDEHEKNYKTRLDIKRENNRIFNQNNNKEMCTRAAVIQNRQSYYTDKEGNFKFDISRGALPCDMPAVFAAVQF